MKLKRLKLVHFRGAKDCTLNFDSTLTVLVGVNGGGKTTLLDSVALMLSWIIARIKSPTGTGRLIQENDITNGATYGWIELESDLFKTIKLAKARAGTIALNEKAETVSTKSDFANLNSYVHHIRENISRNDGLANIPVFAHYQVNRAVIDIPLKIREKHSFDLLSAYENSLTNGTNFRIFFEWYRDREDVENENRKYKDDESKPVGYEYPDTQLTAVRNAISTFLPLYKNLAIRRKPKLRMEIEKNGETLVVNQLSDGEKGFIALIGDLARRLAIANPARNNPLMGEGVVLIDEIDLHLHPQWQKMVVPRLLKVFPNIQFIVTTHSPQVLTDVAAAHIRGLVKNYDIEVFVPEQAIGLDLNSITQEIFGTDTINKETQDSLDEIFKLINDDQFERAKKQIESLKGRINGDTPQIVRAEAFLKTLAEEVPGDPA